MVHVLTEVLNNIYQSLRPKGLLLILRPAKENSQVLVEINGNNVFNGELPEPKFGSYLVATHTAIQNAVQQRLFSFEEDVLSPQDGSFNHDVYSSTTEWSNNTLPLCEDVEEFEELMERINQITGSRVYQIDVLWREQTVLLRKV